MINYQPQLVKAGFQPSTQALWRCNFGIDIGHFQDGDPQN